MTRRVLIVDDDPSMCELIEADLRLRGVEAESFTDAAAALEALRAGEFDVVLSDLNMPGMDGIELCRRIVANRPDVPFVVITAFGSLETAIQALRAGAFDFVSKPVNLEVLDLTIERAARHRDLTEKVKRLSEAVERSMHCGELIGESPPMLELFRQVERTAASEAAVLITGESGTGKELVARALHEKSERSERPFVAVNCAALPEPLLESELFGHIRGAFTDARTSRRGLFAEADGGTLFLDEIGDLPLHLQPKLLRALEEGVVRPLGSDQPVKVSVRVVAATHQDLESAVERGAFRQDLFFRLNVILLEVPPLRARGTDVLLLAQRFVDEIAGHHDKRVKGLSRPVAEALLAYSWPGNVRELRNAVERAVALTSFDTLTMDDLPARLRDREAAAVLVESNDPADLLSLQEVEKRYILHALKATGGNRTLTARALGIDRKTLYRKLQGYGLSEED